ncbi:MAG: Spy/CpxP family protein refolding chaperone [Candidatus Thiodiazotropha sp.]
MKQSSKHILTLVGATALIAGVGSIAFAQGYGPGYGPGWGGHHGMMGGPGGGRGMMMGGPGGGNGMMMGGYTAGFADQQLADLKTTLGITTDQEAAWNRYADAVKARTDLMQSHRQQMFTSRPFNPDQRLNFHQQGMEQLQQVSVARRELFDVLTPQQRVTADTYTGWPCVAR